MPCFGHSASPFLAIRKSGSGLIDRNAKSNIPMADAARLPKASQGLKANCLPYPEVIAQSISVIAPPTVPAAILGLIFVNAGNGTWLSFLLATSGLLFVVLNINQFGLSGFPLHLHRQRAWASSGRSQRMGFAAWAHGHRHANPLRVRDRRPVVARAAWGAFPCSDAVCRGHHPLLRRRL